MSTFVLAAIFPLSLPAAMQQNLHFGAVPSTSSYQFGESVAIGDIASSADGSGTIRFKSPFTLSNTTSGSSQRILVKVSSTLPSSVAIGVSIDEPTGLSSDGPVSMDSTDRSLVSNLQQGGYTGQLHYKIEGDLSNIAKGSIKVFYTLGVT